VNEPDFFPYHPLKLRLFLLAGFVVFVLIVVAMVVRRERPPVSSQPPPSGAP
jgi:hypothetical protein